MPRKIKATETDLIKRRLYFDVRSLADGMTPATAEAGQQAEVSRNGSAWTPANVGPLVHVGRGMYYATIATTLVLVPGDHLSGRYVRAGVTVDTPSREDLEVVNYDPADVPGEVDDLLTLNHGAGSWRQTIIAAGAVAGGGPSRSTLTWPSGRPKPGTWNSWPRISIRPAGPGLFWPSNRTRRPIPTTRPWP
jgi:hypothetical protein